jgi:endonuclease YncB( thermonuclease family)
MTTIGQLAWRIRGVVWRLRAYKWPPSLFVVVVCLISAALLVAALTLDWPVTDGRHAVRGQVTILGSRPTVIDGDTVRWQGRTVRLIGFDAPETGNRARCASELDRGDRATTRLRELIASSNVTVELVRCACPPAKVGTEACNFGRACGILTVNGRDVGDRLIAEDLARPYHCQQFSCPSRGSWC